MKYALNTVIIRNYATNNMGLDITSFTIIVDYDSSHIDILVNDVYRMKKLSLPPESRTGF
jgi:hypothetical protein